MYGSHPDADHQLDLPFSIPALRERCKKLGWTSLRGTRLDEKQEREVSYEVEQERQVGRPPKTKAAVHQVHRFVRDLARTGILNHDPAASVPVSVILEHAITPRDYSVWSSRLYATRDFATTIESSFSSASDYLRPINWILSNNSLDGLIILSPYEVNELLPEIHRSKTVHLHIYAPRIAESMRSFDDLMFHCIPSPSWAARNGETIIQLNLWAGQLYLKDYGEYLRVTRFLGIYSEENQDDTIQLDGFIRPEHRHDEMKDICRFTVSPVPFLKELMSLRRKGIDHSSTHLGRILQARLLSRQDFIEGAGG